MLHTLIRTVLKSGLLTSALALIVGFGAFAGFVGPHAAIAQDVQTRAVILHAATDLGKIEVHFNDDEVANEFEYGQQSDWIEVDPGSVQVLISRDRAGINYTVFNAVYPVAAGRDYYLIITDALVIVGAFDTSPIVDGTARVSVVHGSVDTPAVNVVATSDQADLATQLAYARTSEPVTVPAGEFSAEVRMADTGDVLVTSSGTVEAGMVYQYVLVGTPGDEDKPLEVVTLSTAASERTEATPES